MEYPSYIKKIIIKPDEIEYINLKLDTLFGYLNCNIYPWGDVFVDGKYQGQTPFFKPIILEPGEHLLNIFNPTYTEIAKMLTITRKETLNYQINLDLIAEEVRSKTSAEN